MRREDAYEKQSTISWETTSSSKGRRYIFNEWNVTSVSAFISRRHWEHIIVFSGFRMMWNWIDFYSVMPSFHVIRSFASDTECDTRWDGREEQKRDKWKLPCPFHTQSSPSTVLLWIHRFSTVLRKTAKRSPEYPDNRFVFVSTCQSRSCDSSVSIWLRKWRTPHRSHDALELLRFFIQ